MTPQNVSDSHWVTRRLRNTLGRELFKLAPVRWLWSRRFEVPAQETIPWAPMTKPLRECRLALVTTGGVHLRADVPFDMIDPDGDASYRVIPADIDPGELTITHDYYDHRDAERDFELVLPLKTAASLVEEGLLGGLTARAYSLMGHVDGRRLTELMLDTAPELARRMVADGADAGLFVPA